MIPLSCVNCCHNPLQLGPVGTSFGFCTQHRLVLNEPHLTTCGRLLRKDLLGETARVERQRHEKVYPVESVVTVARPSKPAGKRVEKVNGKLPADAVMEEVIGYGQLESKVASMAALNRVQGVRAEVAMLSLSRGYFANCLSRGGRWTAGVHLLFWTLRRLDREPELRVDELHGPLSATLQRTIEVAMWSVVAFRLAFVADVGEAAKRERDPAGRLASLANDAVEQAGTDAGALLAWLRAHRSRWRPALTPERYTSLREELHVEQD